MVQRCSILTGLNEFLCADVVLDKQRRPPRPFLPRFRRGPQVLQQCGEFLLPLSSRELLQSGFGDDERWLGMSTQVASSNTQSQPLEVWTVEVGVPGEFVAFIGFP